MDTQGARISFGHIIVWTVVICLGTIIPLSGCKEKSPKVPSADKHETKPQREVLYWTCGMHPTVKNDQEGKCPICFMDLVPVYAEGTAKEAGEKVSLKLSENARNLAKVQTSVVERRRLKKEIFTVGKVDYDESKVAYVASGLSFSLLFF